MSKQKTILISANIAWFLHHFEGGILQSLVDRGYAVHCVSQYNKNDFNKLQALGCVPHTVYLNRSGMNPLQDIITFVQYFILLLKLQPVLTLNFTIKPVIYMSMAARILNIPTINTITGLGTIFIAGGLKESLVKALYKISQKRVAKIFILNKEDRELFENSKLCKPSVLTLVPGAGVNLNIFKYSTVPNSDPVFLFIGRILKDKGVREFIQAAKNISQKHTNVSFKLLGPIDTESRSAITESNLNELIANGNAIRYLGESNDVRDYIRDATCIVLPSYREGIPTVLLEALAIGRPIITTTAPGCNIVVDDTINGFVIPIKDVGALTQVIEQVLALSHDKLNIMGKASRAKAEEEFDENIVIAKYLQEIDYILID